MENSVINQMDGAAALQSSQLLGGASSSRSGRGSRGSVSSRSSTKVRRKEIEAERDQKLLDLEKRYADMVRQKKSYEIKIRSYQRRLAVLGDNPIQPQQQLMKSNLEAEIATMEEALEIIQVDLESVEATYLQEREAIRSQSELALAQVSDDEEFASLSDDESQKSEHIQSWAIQVEKSRIHDDPQLEFQEKQQQYYGAGSLGLSGAQDKSLELPLHGSNQWNDPNLGKQPPPPATAQIASKKSVQFNSQANSFIPVGHGQRQGAQGQLGIGLPSTHGPGGHQFRGSHPPPLTYGPHAGRGHQHNGGAGVDKDQMMINLMSEQLKMMQMNQLVKKSYVDKKLPTFDGDPAMWINFRDAFLRSTAKYHFDEDQNMMRIQDALKGDAKSTVAHLLANPLNVNVVMKTLESRFGRSEYIIDYCIQKIKANKKPELTKVESMDEFGRLVETLVMNIISFNEQDYLWNKQLLDEIVEMTPPLWKQMWYEYRVSCGNVKLSLQTFHSWLQPKIEAVRLQIKPKLKTTGDKEKKEGRTRGPGSVNAASGDEEKKTSREPCPACQKKGHTLDTCYKFPKLPLDERWKIVKDGEICVSCLTAGHRANKCTVGKKCTECEKSHHPTLHGEKSRQVKEETCEKKADDSTTDDKPKTLDTSSSSDDKKKASDSGLISVAIIEGCDGPLQIVKINVKGGNGNRRVFAMLDGGASKSLITKSLADVLGITGEKVDYKYSGISGQTVTAKNAMKVNFEVAGLYRGARFQPLHGAMTVDEIHMRPYSFNFDEAKKHWPHLKRVNGTNLVKIVPEIIIGNNNPHLSLPRRVVRGSLYDPVGIRTVLGWTISGNFDVSDNIGSSNSMQIVEGSDDYLHELIKKSFALESFGIHIPKEKGINMDEKRAYSILEKTTKKIDGGYETGLLWREDHVEFPESYTQALQRLRSMEKKMKKDPEFDRMYRGKFGEYLEKKYVRKLSPEEVKVHNPKTWIIPHFGITNPNKPGKMRFITDAKAKSNGVSLNDKLLKGPDLIRPLTSVLMNFRRHAVAITGDISDMFHRVRIRKEDQPSQSLLWRDGDDSREPDHYVMEVMIFGATSSPSSAIYVKNKNAESFEDKYPDSCKAIVQNMYVDDLLHSVPTVELAIQAREEISEINKCGGFVVCKWMSNKPEVLASIPEELRADGVKDLEEHSELPTERVLGIWWDPNQDAFTYRLNLHKVPKDVLEGRRPTKREVCSLVMSLFDPLGFINHYKVKGMMILQETWRSGITWDDEVPTTIFELWSKWLSMLPEITNVRVPRMYSSLLEEAESVELHTFVDSSEESYCAICYLRVHSGDHVDVALVTSKVRVAPLKKHTIPRLELQAALLGSRIANSIQAELDIKITGRKFWSDSKTVLLWIRSSAIRYKEFVANRIGEIQETTEVQDWKWVPTALNVADIATRFNCDISFDPEGDWYSGPKFLKEAPKMWPKERKQEDCGTIALATVEILGDESGVGVSSDETCGLGSGEEASISAIIPEVNRFSSYFRLIRAAAAVKVCGLHWLHVWRNRKTNPKMKNYGVKITSTDVVDAEERVLQFIQQEAFKEDYQQLKKRLDLKKKSKLFKLSPALVNGLLRIRGRIGAAEVDDSVKMPIILPSRHHVTELIIDREHQQCAHQGKETVFANLRQKFWVTDGRQAVKRAFMRCQECKLKKAKPVIPEMGSLPPHRLASHHPPFTYTGLDCFGPMEVAVGRRREKRWGVIFCCMVTRAVHLEVIHDMSTDEMMMAASRFIDSRGRPAVLISDNGTNFVGASNEMRKMARDVDFEEISKHGKFHPIKWKFNPPSAPHMGGVWERLVQSVKKCLSSLLKEKTPRDTTLLTCFKAVENILNSRPITYVSSDKSDPEPLTPNHLLRGVCDVGPAIPVDGDPNAVFLRTQWKRAQLFIDQFWKRWTSEYLPRLIRRDKWHQRSDPIMEGELVFIVDDNAPRNVWRRGVIAAVHPGTDGQVRVADVTYIDERGTKKTRQKPLSKLCPLGLRMEIK